VIDPRLFLFGPRAVVPEPREATVAEWIALVYGEIAAEVNALPWEWPHERSRWGAVMHLQRSYARRLR
jgi:hypothetical protein